MFIILSAYTNWGAFDIMKCFHFFIGYLGRKSFGKFWSLFWAIEFQKKMFLRFTDLYFIRNFMPLVLSNK